VGRKKVGRGTNERGSKLLCSRDHSGGFWDVAVPGLGQATPKPGEPHQNRCTVFDEGRLPRLLVVGCSSGL